MLQFQQNTQTESWMEGWGDPISYDPSSYHRNGVPTSTTAADWHL